MRFIVGGADAWRLGPGRPPHSPLCVFSIPTPRDMPSWTPETLCGAVDEARALASMYAGGAHLDDDPCDVDDAHEGFLEIAEAALASDEGSLAGVPALEVTVRLLGARLRGGPVAIAVAMPRGTQRPPRWTSGSKQTLARPWQTSTPYATPHATPSSTPVRAKRPRWRPSRRCARDSRTSRRRRRRRRMPRAKPPRASRRRAHPRIAAPPPDPDALARRLIWFHHIKAPSKRRDAVAWARELRLGGFSKPGYPGVVVVEGRREDCEEYVIRLKSLSWKAMSVRLAEDEGEDVGAGKGSEGVAGGGGSEGGGGGGSGWGQVAGRVGCRRRSRSCPRTVSARWARRCGRGVWNTSWRLR